MSAGAGKYLYVAATAVRSHLAYLGHVLVQSTFLVVILYIFLRLWQTTYGQTGAAALGGFTLPQMLWYLVATEAIVMSGPRVAPEIDNDVRTGALAVHLLRPLSYPLYRLGTTLGERLVRFAVNGVVGAVVATVLVGQIPVRPAGLLLFALGLPLAFLVDFLAYLVIGLGAFWLENTTGLTIIYSRATMMLGGMMLPLTLFPEPVQRALDYLPFAQVIYGPARLFVSPDPRFFAGLVGRQLVAAALLAGVAALVHRAALRRIQAHGG